MFKKLGKIITILNVIGFVVIMIVGGTSIFLAHDILANSYKIQHVSVEMGIITNVRTDSSRLMHYVHNFFISQDELYSNNALAVIESIKKQIQDFKKHEHIKHRIKTPREIELLDIVLEDVDKLKIVTKIFNEFSEAGILNRNKMIQLEGYANEIEDSAIEINKIHLSHISEWEEESVTTMWRILFLYFIFIAGGGVCVFVGHSIFTRKIVKPIMEVSTATVEFAEGTYNKRVYTDSQTEIGKLYQSFNKMAEKLQENDEILRKFNESLERKVRERTFELERAHLQLRRTEKIAAIGQIAAGVTHEVKHPLNSLSLSAHELSKEISEKLGNNSSAYKSASLFKHEINRINNILEEFIKFARFPEPRYFKNNINNVVEVATDVISDCIREKGVKLDLLLQENIPVFEFDAGQLEEVLINLSKNSLKAMDNSGTLEISTAMEDSNVIIKISDTGKGISEKNLEKIFSPFYSTNEISLGLGLSIVQRIVENHGGKINCTSTVGKETVFRIILPMNKR